MLRGVKLLKEGKEGGEADGMDGRWHLQQSPDHEHCHAAEADVCLLNQNFSYDLQV